MVNRERKRKVEIKTEKWEEYFRKILGKSKSEVKLELGNQGRGKRERGRRRKRDKLERDGKSDKEAEEKKGGKGRWVTK